MKGIFSICVCVYVIYFSSFNYSQLHFISFLVELTNILNLGVLSLIIVVEWLFSQMHVVVHKNIFLTYLLYMFIHISLLKVLSNAFRRGFHLSSFKICYSISFFSSRKTKKNCRELTMNAL